MLRLAPGDTSSPALLPAGFLTDLHHPAVVIQGVGSVLVFLPQILLLFFFIVPDGGHRATWRASRS